MDNRKRDDSFEANRDFEFEEMKYQIKHETKKKVHEIIAAAEKRDEDLLKQLMDDVEQRAD